MKNIIKKSFSLMLLFSLCFSLSGRKTFVNSIVNEKTINNNINEIESSNPIKEIDRILI